MAEKLIVAKTAEEAIRCKTKDNVYLAGGTEIMRLGSSVEADSFVSLRKIESLHEITPEDGRVRIGAACSFQDLIESDAVPTYLKEAAEFMASRTRRNMATIGGNIKVARDDSFLLPTMIAVDAKLVLKDINGESEVSIVDYMSKISEHRDKLITAVCVPTEGISVKSVRSANTAQSHARLTASLALRDGVYTAAAVVKNSGIYRFGQLSTLLSEKDPTEDEIVELFKTDDGISLKDDLLYGGADYRRYLIGITFALMYEELKGGRS